MNGGSRKRTKYPPPKPPHLLRRFAPENLPPVVKDLVRAVPELRNSFDEHLRNYGEILSYIYLPDAVRDLAEQMHSGTLPRHALDKLSVGIELALESRDPAIEDLIGLALLDELKLSALWPLVRGHLGPRAREILNHKS